MPTLAKELEDRYISGLAHPAAAASLRVLCDIVVRTSSTIVFSNGENAASLPEEWDRDGPLLRHCFLQNSTGVIVEAQFVPTQHYIVLITSHVARNGSESIPPPRTSSLLIEQPRVDQAFVTTIFGTGESVTAGATVNYSQLRPTPASRYGENDIAPGGNPMGFDRSGVPAQSGPFGSGMMVGPHSSIFQPGGAEASGLGRFDPIHPPLRGRRGGGVPFGGPNTVFPGEPDPDHLRPFLNNSQPQGGFNYGW